MDSYKCVRLGTFFGQN